MREAAFLKENAESWKQFEMLLDQRRNVNPDVLAELFVRLTDDVAYARTFYPDSKTTKYLNTLAARVHQEIYRNKREKSNRFINFWRLEVPEAVYESRGALLTSLVIFLLAMLVGVVSTLNDEKFIRLILGDEYVNMTLENIRNGDPLGIYSKHDQLSMFATITFNNILVSFYAFAMGLLISFGTGYVLLQNGIMLGAFQTLFYKHGLLAKSFLVVYIHGTFEISAIVVAGGAGLVMGNSILFPGTYSRLESFRRGAKRGTKIIIGLVPFFFIAGFLESFVTRYTNMPLILSLLIIFGSLAVMVYYFVIYPETLHRKKNHAEHSTEN